MSIPQVESPFPEASGKGRGWGCRWRFGGGLYGWVIFYTVTRFIAS